MSTIRLLIAEDNEELKNELFDFFADQPDIIVAGEAGNGLEALKIIRETPIDVLLLDMIMPHMDGFGVLEQLRNIPAEKRPQVIAVTGLGRDDFIRRAVDLGVSYYMIKPVELSILLDRVHDLMRHSPSIVTEHQPIPFTGMTLEDRLSNLFLTMGIPAHIKGYQFLREAIKQVIEHPQMISGITKELYPAIAHRFGTTASKVERAIRHAIEVAWSRGRVDTLNKAFGCCVALPGEKPTNGEFIALIADKLSSEHSA